MQRSPKRSGPADAFDGAAQGGSREGAHQTLPRSGPSPHSNHVIAEWPLNEEAVLRLCVRIARGDRVAIDLRTWWQPPDSPAHIPTKKGASMNVARARELLEALGRAIAKAEAITAPQGR